MDKIKSYLSKVNNMTPAAKASFWFIVSNIVLKGISFITTPIFTRLLDVADYGVSNMFVTWEGIISIFATLSLSGGVYNVAMTKFEDDVDKVTSSMIGLTICSSTVVYTVCIAINLLFPSLFELSTSYLVFMWVQTFFNAVTAFWLMRKRYIYDYKKVIAYTFSNAILSPVVAIIAVYLSTENKAYAKVIGSGLWPILIGFCIMLILVWKGKKLYHKEYWKFALKFNIPLLPHYLSSGAVGSVGKIMLNYFYDATYVGLYGIAGSITGLMSIVTSSINNALIPQTLQSIKNGTIKELKKSINIYLSLIAFMCCGILMFSREAILILATPEYLDSIWFVAPLVLGTFTSFLSGILGNIVFYYEETKFMSYATMVTAIANVVLNFIGLKLFGPYAVGYVSLITNIIRFVMYYFTAKKFEKNLKDIVSLRFIVLMFLFLFVFMLFSLIFWNNLILKITILVIISVLVLAFRKKILSLLATMKKTGGERSDEQ